MKISTTIPEEEEFLEDPMINAARIGKQHDNARQHDNTSYTPDRCKVCGLTQKECHQVWKTIHDPNDVKKCPFRGPEFITDKHTREKVLQYNLKHNGTKELLREIMKPPASADLPSPAIKKTTFDLDTQDNLNNQKSTTPITNLHQPAIKKTSINQDFTEFPIDTMLEFIENMETDYKDTSLHSPKVSMATIHEDTYVHTKGMINTSQERKKKSKNNIITPAQFYRLQE